MDAALMACIRRRRRRRSNKDDDKHDGLLFCMTQEPFRDMIAGMRSDIVVVMAEEEEEGGGRRAANLAELEEYAYQVAGTVGLRLPVAPLGGTSGGKGTGD
jgi:phytoene/squalene synthetase